MQKFRYILDFWGGGPREAILTLVFTALEVEMHMPIIERLALKQLLEKVTEENLHHEVGTGCAMGNEVW